jgi:hypothetical protein
MSLPETATAVGDQGLEACRTVVIFLSGLIFRTAPQPAAAT